MSVIPKVNKKTRKTQFLLDAYVYQSGKRTRVRKLFSTKAEAKNLEADIVKANREKSNRVVVGKATRTINELANYYFTLPRFLVLRENTKKRNTKLISHFCEWCQSKGLRYVHEVTKEHAQQYCAYISEKWKAKGRQHVFIAAKMIFKEELERDNPCIVKNPFMMKSPFKAKQYQPIAISDGLYMKLREHMSQLESPIFDLFFYTGCRSGELLYLCWEQVDADAVRFEAHKIFDKKQGKYIDWESKNERNRTIPLNTQSRLAFEALRKITKNSEFVVPDECREIRHWLTRRFAKIKQRTVESYPDLKTVLFSRNRDKNITPKTLRSTFITNVAVVSGNPLIAQFLGGHSSFSTTQKHYTDYRQLDIRSSIDKLGERVAKESTSMHLLLDAEENMSK